MVEAIFLGYMSVCLSTLGPDCGSHHSNGGAGMDR